MNLGRGQQISLQQVENAIYQLREVPDYLKGVEEALRAGIQDKITHAAESMENVPQQFEDLVNVANVEDSPFYAPFRWDFEAQ